MRTLKLLALGVLFVAGTALPVNAQAPPEQTPPPAQETTPAQQTPAIPPPAPTPQVVPGSDGGRFYLNVSIGGQWSEQSFTDSSTFRIYDETGAVASGHTIGGGTLFNVSIAAKVWKNIGIGLAYSTLKNKNDATVTARVPHPVLFGQSRTVTATAVDVEHSENVVHLQFMWMVPLTNKFQLAFMAGPSFFTVRQTVATVQAPQELREGPENTTVTINNLSLTDVKDSPVGVNVGVDGTYWIRTIGGFGVGIGGFVRYAGASLDLPTPAGVERDTELKTGGPQGAVGLRFRF